MYRTGGGWTYDSKLSAYAGPGLPEKAGYFKRPDFFTCPSTPENTFLSNDYYYRLYKNKYWPVSLACNYYTGLKSANWKYLKIGLIKQPSRAVIVGDSNDYKAAYKSGGATLDYTYRDFRHNGRKTYNCLYLAGAAVSIQGVNTMPQSSYSYNYSIAE